MKSCKVIFLIFFVTNSINLLSQEASFPGRSAMTMDPAYAPFYHGVASGDPLDDRVIIWTRITPLCMMDSIEVKWFVALDTLFTQIVKSGTFYTNENIDYTVKIDVTGLTPNTWYYYYFSAFGFNSMIGRTRTIPQKTADINNLRIALVSGSNYNNGYFSAYEDIAKRNDIDLVIHLGDYIYEYETGHYGSHPERGLEPVNEILNLGDYRMRYSHYRLDPDLRRLHQQYPWYVIWDDHEVANNAWKGGAENHTPSTEGPYGARKSAAIQAFFEWIPMREINDPNNPENKLHHSIQFGKLAKIILLDTRHEGRDKQDSLSIDDPNKTMLGQKQYNWLTQELYNAQYSNDTVIWKLITQQVMFAPLLIAGQVVNKDQWDGYRVERQKILNYINYYQIKNTVILTGDIHTSWANDVPDPNLGPYGPNGQGSGTVEFVTQAVSSPSVDFGAGIGASTIMSFNPHIKWVNLDKKGYNILDVRPQKVQSDWYFISSIEQFHNYTSYFAQGWYVNYGERFLRNSPVPTQTLNINPPFAPLLPRNIYTSKRECSDTNDLVVLNVYPNPFEDKFEIQFYSRNTKRLIAHIFDLNGKIVYSVGIIAKINDINYAEIEIPETVKSGNYILAIETKEGIFQTRNIIKL